MARIEINESVVALAVSRSSSLRTTIPRHIAAKLGLEQGDRLEWDIDKKGSKWIAFIVRKD